MKKILLIATLLITGLLSMPTYAASYCVTMPDGGNKWNTKRDNSVQLRFRYSFRVTASPDLNKVFTHSTDGERNRPDGKIDYKSYSLDGEQVCIDISQLTEGIKGYVNNYDKANNGEPFPEGSTVFFKSMQADIKWGGDCAKVTSNTAGNFTIHRRGHDHVNPWRCAKS